MNRPYIFCHMMTALDGKIMGSYMETPQGSAAGDVFYDIAFGKEPFYHHQGWLSGRVTTDDNFTFYKKPDLDENAPAVPAGDFIAQPDFGMFYVSVDPHGKLAANVTFEPGCRNNWHIHHADKGGGQLLICTAGEGWYQEEGKAAVSLHEGSVVMIPANVKHWHGAKKDSWFSHIAVEVPGEHCKNEWCEPVSDEEYTKL